MKAKKIFTYAILMATLTSSCVGLDTLPYDRETDQTFWVNDPNAALSTLNTCYTYLGSMDEMMYSDAMTDNAYTKQPNDYTQNIGNGTFSTADPYVRNVWNNRYAGIRACNMLIENIDRVSGLQAELKQRYMDEAITIRAYLYYDLYTRFGAVPYFTHVISIAESQSLPRTEKATVVQNVIDDLNAVVTRKALPLKYEQDDRGRITLGAAKSILAKVYLFENKWDKVKQITGDIIESKVYSLFPNYSGLFEINNEYNSEVILDIQYRPSTREHHTMYSFLPPSLGGYSQLSPLQELVDSYLMLNGKTISDPTSGYDSNKPFENRDPRLKATVMYTGNDYLKADGSKVTINCEPGAEKDGYGYSSNCTATGYYIKKYWDNTYRADLQSGLNPILCRYADILLMYAEASAELGQFDEQVWDMTIRPIRARAGFTETTALNFPSGKQKAELIDIIRNERRCELALEGQRRNDIIRWKIAEKVLNGWCHGITDPQSTVNTDNGHIRIEKREFKANKHYLWPIPQAERDLNKNLTQNENW